MALRRAGASLLGRLAGVQLEVAQPSTAVPTALRAITSAATAQAPVHIEDEVYNRQRQQVILGNRVPTLSPDTWVAPSAVLVGDVDLFDKVSVWYGCVLRGDLNAIKVGAFSNIQDRTVIHAARSSPTGLPAATQIGRSVTVGRACVLRSATVEDEAVIGDKCVLLEGSLVEKHAVLAPGSVLPPGRRIPSGQLWAGAPARFVRDLTKDEKAEIAPLAAAIFPLVEEHADEFLPTGTAYREAEELRKILKPSEGLAAGAAALDGPNAAA